MAQASKVIITCAITGSVHTPSMSPYLPVTPAEIAASAIEAAAAGAAVVHLHARDPVTGMPSQNAQLFAQFLPQIKAESNVVINLTTGGASTMTVEERLLPALRFKPEVASLNMGSMNFGMYEMLGRFKEFRHDWERPYLESSEDRIFRNTFKDIAHILEACNDNGTRFEIECYDIGHLYTAAHFVDRGLLKAPVFIQSVFGVRGGIGVHPEDIAHMKRTADRLFGADYHWSALGAGAQQPRVLTQALLLGGHVRVGLEDNLWLRKGQLAKSNAEQVTAIRSVIEQLGFQIATAEEARVMLGLKGSGEVAF
ncbi:3-keto-5-aminohexanoate cleavage protein [Paraburkholderia phenoliruptrix]|uniref:3-keto-5-aminohexanoate cleavage protein n=1 Tax=Paraburkholderia phenoliruptrix TaxID=252970 RepID=UPI001C6E67D5|nr:3-keto-5-aminohexanoate cleavage protein [Paraburkholderia phenoliruptrix]MBW9107996.1 3-keto-5-aminohexanoate cleavage protein [Paraburkholderia phenoliruptrix]MBW9133315.1 3-keto-5-aminohexanoate cleavage protein [Paraburkholderia ginsengiterrae]